MMSMKRLANPQLINGMPLLILLAMPAITYAAAEDYEDTSDNQVTVDHWGDAAVATITAWSVMVIVSLVSVFSLVMCLLL